MYIVNISFFVTPVQHQRWLELVQQQFIPFVEDQHFELVAFTRVISAQSEDHFTYSLLVNVPDIESYNRLLGEVLDEYKSVANPLFGQSVVWLASLLKRVPEHPNIEIKKEK